MFHWYLGKLTLLGEGGGQEARGAVKGLGGRARGCVVVVYTAFIKPGGFQGRDQQQVNNTTDRCVVEVLENRVRGI